MEVEALFSALRRNDPGTTVIPFNTYTRTQQYGHTLGEALQGNQYVSTMKLDIEHLLDADEEGTDSITLLIRYIGESKAMRRVQLDESGAYTHSTVETKTAIVSCILLAILENPCIKELVLDSIKLEIFAGSFAAFLRTTRSLKTLRLNLARLAGPASRELLHNARLAEFDDPASRELLHNAFVANQSLESLTYDSTSDRDFEESVLLRLDSPSRLRELKLQCENGVNVSQIHALVSFLGTTTLLEHLQLGQYDFDKEQMEHLVEGLYSNQTLTKLSLSWCTFSLEATDVFRTYMQSCETQSSIRELSFKGGIGCNLEPYGAMLASLLSIPDDNQVMGSSIGSLLQVLELHTNMAQFCDALAANASRIRLPCLHLHFPINDVWEALNRCLPNLVYLKKLELPFYLGERVNDDVFHNFTAAMQTNGSLQQVIIKHFGYFNEAELEIIHSTCKKNEMRQRLVADVATDAYILPLLFQSAKQASRTAPNVIATGLLTAGDSIGPKKDIKKRSVSTSPLGLGVFG